MLENKLYQQVKVFHRSKAYLYLFKTTIILHFIWLGEPGLCLMKGFNCNPFECNTAQTVEFYNSIMPPFQDHTMLYIGQRQATGEK